MVQRTIKLTRVSRVLWAAGIAVAAASVLAACGDSRDEPAPPTTVRSQGPEIVVRRYFAALARGDGAAVCALLTDTGQQGLRQLPPGERARSCEDAVRLLGRDALWATEPRVSDLRVSGEAATARVTSKRPPYDSGVVLRREEGAWKVAFPPAVVSRFDSPPGVRPHEDEEAGGDRHR